jgi:hypothetical protein
MITADLRQYLQQTRDAVVASLDGLSEYDIRRPMTPTATSLLGLVKHLAGIEFGYLGACVGRDAPVPMPWTDETIWDGADMWALPGESREYLVGLYQRAWQHSDESLEQFGLDAPATVAWWPEERRTTTLGHLLVRVIAETAQHAGHADIVREMIDGRGGKDQEDTGDKAYWDRYVAQVQEAADQHR